MCFMETGCFIVRLWTCFKKLDIPSPLPKYGSVRKMYPAPIVMNLLRQQKEKQALYKKRAEEARNNRMNLVFTKPNGENVGQSTAYKQLKNWWKQLGARMQYFMWSELQSNEHRRNENDCKML